MQFKDQEKKKKMQMQQIEVNENLDMTALEQSTSCAGQYSSRAVRI